jgi:hypothetical protein
MSFRSILGRSILGRSILGRSILGRSILGRSILGRSILGRSICLKKLGDAGGVPERQMRWRSGVIFRITRSLWIWAGS